jgi:hypothetical protein
LESNGLGAELDISQRLKNTINKIQSSNINKSLSRALNCSEPPSAKWSLLDSSCASSVGTVLCLSLTSDTRTCVIVQMGFYLPYAYMIYLPKKFTFLWLISLNYIKVVYLSFSLGSNSERIFIFYQHMKFEKKKKKRKKHEYSLTGILN